MSLSAAMSSAVLGLRAAGRGAEVISSNISNALTPGYGKRELVLTSGSAAGLGGVREVGVLRLVDAGLASDRRMAEAASSDAQVQLSFHARVEGLLGTPDDASSLSAKLASFEGALVAASSRPDAGDRLTAAVGQARDLASGLRAASKGIQDARSQADRTIGAQVKLLNASLEQVQNMNVQIRRAQAQGGDIAGLMDQRQQAVDSIGELVPVREIARDGGQIALYSTGGAALLDGRATTIGFTDSNTVTPYMSLNAGTLSGLTINGQPVRTDSERGALRGGALGAQFAVRDELSIKAGQEIDALARDLVDRFANPLVDPSLAPSDAGLFTDEGGAFTAIDELGLASRMDINAAVDPHQGGETWRLRDGIGATVQGPVGETSLLQNLTSALTDPHLVASGSLAGGSLSASALTSAMISEVGGDIIGAEQRVSFTSSRLSELTQLQLADGVDTDHELQKLLQVEQAYAANARLIQVMDELMQILNRL